MDAGEAREFLSRLGCSKITTGSRWVRSTCPFEFLHSGGRDRNPSFAVSIDPGDTSCCRCQACGYGGDLMPMAWKLDKPAIMDFLQRTNQVSADRPDIERKPDEDDIRGRLHYHRVYVPAYARESTFVHPDDEPQAVVAEEVLKKAISDMPDYVLEYLTRNPDPIMGIKGRRLSKLTVAEWELGWHPIQKRIVVPIRDAEGKLVALSGRAWDDDSGPKYLHSRFKRDRELYGQHKRTESRKGYLCEGFFQVIYLWQNGYMNALGRMGTHLSKQQIAKLVEWFDHLVVVPDGDKAGRDSAKRISESLSGRIATVEVSGMPDKKDADSLEPSQLAELLGPKNSG